ncbi:C-GCAxxG-C-C family protein [Clostridium bornimense]|uniref:C-GCAxxG-C-C family (seleno)protein n=1 Tax=Clostridium bornimense TaxID=1216932 RepID=UPI001C0FB737|nr:C-GCAxxG-C-C family (seleno)protein [Clostridium bornimense]MBU5317804.1 C-GCAxxG-C-C family protein [Clostridium bornimense]
MKVSDYHKQGYNCAEAMIRTYNEEHGTDIPISLGSGMGSGFASGSLCGAISAATIIIGYLTGRKESTESNMARVYTKEMMDAIREKYNTHLCKDFKANKITCAEIENYTYDVLVDILKSV